MNARDIIPFPATIDRSRNRKKAILLTSYNTGANKGKNLGVAGYSHDIVAQLYLPLLSRWGEVVLVANPKQDLEAAVRDARERNLDPVHVSILPLQDVCLAQSAPNIVAPAWEFPDVPDHEFGGNPQNDWPATADRCDSLIVGGPFTLDALRNGGTTTPIHIVPVPTPNAYFELPAWNPAQKPTFDVSAFILPQQVLPLATPVRQSAAVADKDSPRSQLKEFGRSVERFVRHTSKSVFGHALYERCSRVAKAAYGVVSKPTTIVNEYDRSSRFDLSGVVYTSIFNPVDGRKNWRDLLTGFLHAFRDCDDATLVVKLITSKPYAVKQVLESYNRLDMPHRCRLIFITDYLAEEQLCQLAQASTYYLQTTKAEGNCLPLMNYLAAGRPGISPCHSAIADYFDDDVGFVVESHAEPSAWPHDPLLRVRSTWARIVWTSLVEQLRASYELAKSQPAGYQALAARARERMFGWASEEQVWRRLRHALDATVGGEVGYTENYDGWRRAA